MRKIWIPTAIAAMIVLDQLVKWWIVEHIALDTVQDFIPNVLSLAYLRNYGAAWSLLQNQQFFFIIVTLVVMTGAVWYLVKNLQGSLWLVSSLSLVIAGGLGNFIDRLRLGYVVDMFHLDFINFPIFNVADSYLTVGVLILFICLMKEEDHGLNN
ncbi:signal peptidase II [Streptococcus ovis]|uniref:signal peptidase II n=1 Tax=Streptococcus ovis TaxID=82806 RepID=UPI0003648538|nr:signal peptidase II [Streptococcus ovis]